MEKIGVVGLDHLQGVFLCTGASRMELADNPPGPRGLWKVKVGSKVLKKKKCRLFQLLLMTLNGRLFTLH